MLSAVLVASVESGFLVKDLSASGCCAGVLSVDDDDDEGEVVAGGKTVSVDCDSLEHASS